MGFWVGVVDMTEENDAPPGQAMPPLTGRERSLVSRFPLPAGVPDVLVNKKSLAAALDVSTTTIDAWLMLPDPERIPYVERGTNGRSYVFRLSVAFAWRQARDAAEEADRKVADDAVAQLRLELLGGSASDRARAALSPKEQREALAAEREFMLAAKLRRDLVEAQEVVDAMEGAFGAIRDGLDAAPDRLGRELSLDGPQIEKVQNILDDVLREARDAVAALFS
ncbi:terminase small subunit [Rhodobacter phage RcCronus]|uniref:Terminase small subunit n=1 Tax=Rhodobacter phage RcCronus TaxID=1662333 RepID=A0A0K1LM88_9CAUD|nr:terminase small subunit [Rhodobacter phage RcCronus]AKU43290.1 terminase small subunit [Rhodobacter phage RcCronus]